MTFRRLVYPCSAIEAHNCFSPLISKAAKISERQQQRRKRRHAAADDDDERRR